MLQKFAKALIFIALVFSAKGLSAQDVSSSYSSIGIGLLKSDAQASHIGMGGVGVSTGTPMHSNRLNPALLVDNTFTVFDFGMNYELSEIKSETTSQTLSATNLAYLSVVFPIKKNKWAIGISYSPYSTVNYELVDNNRKLIGASKTDTTYTSKLKGSGGINKFEINLAHSPLKGLKLGIGGIVYAGSITREEILHPNVTVGEGTEKTPSPTYKVRYTNNQIVRHFGFRLGAAYTTDLTEKVDFNVGAVYEYAGDFNPKVETISERFSFDESENSPVNYVTGKKSEKKSMEIPSRLAFGVGIGEKRKWSVQTDFSTQDWSKFSDISGSNQDMKNSYKIGLGGEWTPDFFSVKSYFRRMTYRLGGYYEKSPIVINDHQLDDLGITAGFSLPVRLSTINFGFKFGRRGTTSDGLLQENYFQLTTGITFGDNSWFVKRKYD